MVAAATYSYNSTGGLKTVTQNNSGNWLLAGNGSAGPFNVAHMAFTGPAGTPPDSIQSEPSFTISPSDTMRVEPFGVPGTNTFENTEVISMDSHVLSMLASGDVRANYFMTGATWTAFGSNPSNTNLGVGTNQLANAAMETYAQGSNCFGCHQNINPSPRVTTEVSHIFDGLQPLF